METSPSTGPGPFLTVDEEGIGWLTFDDPSRSMNVLTEEVMRGLTAALEEAAGAGAEGDLRVLVLHSGKERGFVAGADVTAIEAVQDPEEAEQASRFGQAVFQQIERLPVPTVAAIHGICLGGGTEMALACTWRVASDAEETRIGLPEVQLGILPAWGGTTRLPRLVGLRPALDMLLTGRRVSGRRARRIGLVDEILPAPTFQEEVRRFAREVAGGRARTPRKRPLPDRLLEATLPGRRLVLAAARRSVLRETRGHYPAPLKILEVVRRSWSRPLEQALDLEARAGGALIASSVCKNLIHVFNLREEARKGRGVEAPVEPRPVARIGVVGAGVMGGGIAQLAAYHGIEARLRDIRHDAVARGLRHAREVFDRAVQRRKLTRREAARRMELVSGGLGYEGFGRVDLVVEAVVERMEVKEQVLAEVEERVRDDCILTTNTSTLSVTEMARVLKRPGNFCGMHFFNPVHRMPLVEVVRGEGSSDTAVATVYALALALGKVPVVVQDGPGFLVNRILAPYLNEAGHLLQEGLSVEAVDGAGLDFGMPMGPLRLIDEIGIDVMRHAGDTLHAAFGERMAPAPPLLALGESGRLGRKGKLGFYRYEGRGSPKVDPGVYAVLGLPVPPRRAAPDPRAVRARLLLAMLNEAVRALEDAIVRRAAEVDLAMVMGTGFPPFRGGLLRHADRLHPRSLLDRLQEHEERYGARFAPPPLLRDLAAQGRGFYEAFP